MSTKNDWPEKYQRLTRELQNWLADPTKSRDPELERLTREVLLMSAAFQHADKTRDPEDAKLFSELLSRVRRDFYNYWGHSA